MKTPASTGQAAVACRVPEPRLNDLVRRGKVNPAPRVVAGRRLWEPFHIRQAARHLGVLDDELEQQLRAGELPSSGTPPHEEVSGV